MWQNGLTVGKTQPRMTRERQTVAAMIDLYCHSHHGDDTLCSECAELLVYASERLGKCPFQEGKTVCSRCPVHCFQPAMRESIRAVMRFSGPRMLRKHPIMAVRHFIDRGRKEPVRPGEQGPRTTPG